MFDTDYAFGKCVQNYEQDPDETSRFVDYYVLYKLKIS